MIHRGTVVEEEWTKLDSDGPLVAVIHSITDSSYNTLLLVNYDLYQPAYWYIYTSIYNSRSMMQHWVVNLALTIACPYHCTCSL